MIVLLCTALLLCSGCGSDGPELVEAGGVVIYQGKPVEGATVLFMPPGGAPATGRTDAEGRFTFVTGGCPGALVGTGDIAITAVEQTRTLTREETRTMSPQQLAEIRRPLIPQKYSKPDRSGLTATVTEEPVLNEFVFDLE